MLILEMVALVAGLVGLSINVRASHRAKQRLDRIIKLGINGEVKLIGRQHLRNHRGRAGTQFVFLICVIVFFFTPRSLPPVSLEDFLIAVFVFSAELWLLVSSILDERDWHALVGISENHRLQLKRARRGLDQEDEVEWEIEPIGGTRL